jgi:hypothetical protein
MRVGMVVGTFRTELKSCDTAVGADNAIGYIA